MAEEVSAGSSPGGGHRNFQAGGLCVRGEGCGGPRDLRLAGEQRKEKGKARVLPLFKVT